MSSQRRSSGSSFFSPERRGSVLSWQQYPEMILTIISPSMLTNKKLLHLKLTNQKLLHLKLTNQKLLHLVLTNQNPHHLLLQDHGAVESAPV